MLGLIWTPYDPSKVEIAIRLLPPSAEHLLGTDHLGRDLLSMMMAGASITLGVAAMAVLIGVIVGVPLGLTAAARKGHLIDDLILRVNDIVFAFPALLTAILITARFGPGAVNAMLAIGIFNIPVFARITRAAALPVWQRDFILIARLAGKGAGRTSVEHILPNILPLLMVQAAIQFSLAILAEAGLAYIGLGVQPPQPSWGKMLADGQTLVSLAPQIIYVPGGAILISVLSLNLLADRWKNTFTNDGQQ
jgi:peptide/nickel transport system permease protein